MEFAPRGLDVLPVLSRVGAVPRCLSLVLQVPSTAQQPLFRSSGERVTVVVVARDRNGLLITGLSAQDFEVRDNGLPRDLDFRTTPAISVVTLDSSGSMRSRKLERANEAGHFLLSAMKEGGDGRRSVFDKTASTAQPFTGF